MAWRSSSLRVSITRSFAPPSETPQGEDFLVLDLTHRCRQQRRQDRLERRSSLRCPSRSCGRRWRRSFRPLRPTRVHGVGEALVLRNSPPPTRHLPALGRQSLVDGDSPGGSTPPLGLVHLLSLPLATTLLAPDIARAGPQYPRALSQGRRGEREQPAKHGAYDARVATRPRGMPPMPSATSSWRRRSG